MNKWINKMGKVKKEWNKYKRKWKQISIHVTFYELMNAYNELIHFKCYFGAFNDI